MAAPNEEPLFVDTPENADWTKFNKFDVRVDDGEGGQRLARNVEELAAKWQDRRGGQADAGVQGRAQALGERTL